MCDNISVPCIQDLSLATVIGFVFIQLTSDMIYQNV
jgi:hypothetical protein